MPASGCGGQNTNSLVNCSLVAKVLDKVLAHTNIALSTVRLRRVPSVWVLFVMMY
jgi:hypothetical protein